jgi:hypothetical protein
MTALIDFEQFRDSAISVTTNGRFGSTRLPQTYTIVGRVHPAVERPLNIGSIREHSEDGSFGGSLSSDRSFSPRPPLSHARSESVPLFISPSFSRSLFLGVTLLVSGQEITDHKLSKLGCVQYTHSLT